MIKHPYTIDFGDAERPVTGVGERTRNVVIQPCGCWRGHVWRRAEVRDDAGAVRFEREGWDDCAGLCEVHSAAAACVQLAHAQQPHGQLPGIAIDDRTAALLARAPELMAAAKALDDEIRALGDRPTRKELK